LTKNDYDLVADLYDTYVPASYDLNFFLRETANVSGEVLELMSGTGRVSLPLIEAGIRLTCVDLSARSNAILEEKLRQKGLQAEVIQMDVRELALARQFALVIIPFQSFAHLTRPEDQRHALARIYTHLTPGGKFICTLGNPALRGNTVDGQLRLFRTYPLPQTGGKLLLFIAERFNKVDPQVVEASQLYEEYDPEGVLVKKRLLELHFRLSGREEFEALARQAGFRVKALYGDYNRSSYQPDSPVMIWVLEKPVVLQA